MGISLTGQIQEVEREIALRHNVYPRQVSKGDLKQATADLLIERMEAVRTTLVWLQKHEAVVRAAVDAQKKVAA